VLLVASWGGRLVVSTSAECRAVRGGHGVALTAMRCYPACLSNAVKPARYCSSLVDGWCGSRLERGLKMRRGIWRVRGAATWGIHRRQFRQQHQISIVTLHIAHNLQPFDTNTTHLQRLVSEETLRSFLPRHMQTVYNASWYPPSQGSRMPVTAAETSSIIAWAFLRHPRMRSVYYHCMV